MKVSPSTFAVYGQKIQSSALHIVLLWFGPEPWFEPEPFRTGPKVRFRFGRLLEPNLGSSSRFGSWEDFKNTFEPGLNCKSPCSPAPLSESRLSRSDWLRAWESHSNSIWLSLSCPILDQQPMHTHADCSGCSSYHPQAPIGETTLAKRTQLCLCNMQQPQIRSRIQERVILQDFGYGCIIV
jgi:hypothetical protein